MYSIWLMPSGKEFERYDGLIKELSQRFEAPAFQPHITLFTGIPSLSDADFHQISILSALTTSFEIRLETLEASDDFYKALYLTAKPSSELDTFHKELSQIFTDINYDLKPHLSILYHQLSTKDQTILKTTLDRTLSQYFEATHIQIVKTKGEVSEWETIEVFPLHQTDNIRLSLICDMVEGLAI